MVAALAATFLGSFFLGSRREPAVNAAGVYRLDPPGPCLGRHVAVLQSGRFVGIAGERGSGGSLEVDRRRLTGQVRCGDEVTVPFQARTPSSTSARSRANGWVAGLG